MKRLLMLCAVLTGLAAASTACLRSDGPSSRYEATLVLPFEFSSPYELFDFIRYYFNDGADSVLTAQSFNSGPAALCASLKEDETFTGGFALCIGVDTLDTPDRAPSRFAVFDKGGNDGYPLYAVYHDTLSTLMPEHGVAVQLPSSESMCQPVSVHVQNVQAVVQAVRYGTGLEGGPFGADDYLTLTITGSLAGKASEPVSYKLVDGTKMPGEWTEVDLSKIGKVDALDFRLSSSRSDLPLYCAVDDLLLYYVGIYY